MRWLVLLGGLWMACTSDADKLLQQQETRLADVLVRDPDARLRMWAFQQDPIGHWAPQANQVAHSFSSLGLHTESGTDGPRIVVVGQHLQDIPSEAERARGVVWTQELVFDGTDWTARVRQIEDSSVQGHSDDQWLGDELWFFHAIGAPTEAVAAEGRIDPVLQPGTKQIRSTPPTRTRFEGADVADPSPVRFQGELHLFVTRVGKGGGIYHLKGEQMVLQKDFQGVTVPFASVVDGELWLLAQRLVEGRFMPVLARSTDAVTWTGWEQLFDLDRKQMSGCTTPVMGELSGTRWLFCVESRRNLGSPRPGG